MQEEAPPQKSPAHFKGKDAIEHVAEAHAKGIIAATEIHGTEMPGHIYAAADSAKETALALLLLWALLAQFPLSLSQIMLTLGIFASGWLLWKIGRSAWLGWSRLERLHRVLEQEKWEIEHHRQQEREELRVLYRAKGFEGKLLEDVCDVLMADGERLLRVMVEEELGLSLESQEHPLKQSLGAAAGTAIATLTCGIFLFLWPQTGLIIGALSIFASSAALSAYHMQNRMIPAITWNLGLATLSFGCVYFLFKFFFLHEYE